MAWEIVEMAWEMASRVEMAWEMAQMGRDAVEMQPQLEMASQLEMG